MLTDQLRSNDLRSVREASILEHSFDIFPSFRKVCSTQFSCLIVVALQVWESQPYGSNTDIVRALVGYLALKGVPKRLQLRQNSSAVNKDLMKGRRDVYGKARNVGQGELQPVQDLGVFGLKNSFFFGILLRVLRQSICSSIGLTLSIIDTKVIAKELLGPTDLCGAQAFRIHEAAEVVVVCEDKNLVFANFQIVPPYFKCFNDSQKLAVVGFVLSFCRNHLPRKEGYWMLLAQISLSDYSIWSSSGG